MNGLGGNFNVIIYMYVDCEYVFVCVGGEYYYEVDVVLVNVKICLFFNEYLS